VLHGNSRGIGLGHNSVVRERGNDYMMFHGYDPKDDGLFRLKSLLLTHVREGCSQASLN